MANDGTKLTNPWFEHDENASNDGKILKMFRDFRKLAKDMPREELETFVAIGAYGIFWRLVEFMHGDVLGVDEADIIADDLRIETKYVEKILNDFELFREEDGYYVSDRVLKNLEVRGKKSKKSSDAVNTRWLLYSFNEAYKEFFKEEPILSSPEIENLKKYSKKIPDLKEKLRDIIYTLTFVKFDTDITFKPCANWLLKDNNLGRLLNGEFGKLRHKSTEKEIQEAEKKKAEEQAKENEPNEWQLRVERCSGKADALALLSEFYADRKLVINGFKPLLISPMKSLAEKFELTNKEVIEACQH